MKLEDFLKRADELIALGKDVIAKAYVAYGHSYVEAEGFSRFRVGALSLIASAFGQNHDYYKQLSSSASVADGDNAKIVKGILAAARDEMAGGWFRTAKGIVSAEVFADFMEMAEHLLEEGYKDAAAVMAGSVLEEHLRQLCQANELPVEDTKQGKQVPRKADTLNADLCKAKVYEKLDQKSVTTWLDLRNNAAHGHYEKYTSEQVQLMLQGVANFMTRIPNR